MIEMNFLNVIYFDDALKDFFGLVANNGFEFFVNDVEHFLKDKFCEYVFCKTYLYFCNVV